MVGIDKALAFSRHPAWRFVLTKAVKFMFGIKPSEKACIIALASVPLPEAIKTVLTFVIAVFTFFILQSFLGF